MSLVYYRILQPYYRKGRVAPGGSIIAIPEGEPKADSWKRVKPSAQAVFYGTPGDDELTPEDTEPEPYRPPKVKLGKKGGKDGGGLVKPPMSNEEYAKQEADEAAARQKMLDGLQKQGTQAKEL